MTGRDVRPLGPMAFPIVLVVVRPVGGQAVGVARDVAAAVLRGGHAVAGQVVRVV